jgi:hypothetical protein
MVAQSAPKMSGPLFGSGGKPSCEKNSQLEMHTDVVGYEKHP